MRNPKRILFIIVLAVGGLLGPQAGPSEAATHVGAGVFTGHATVSPGLSSPVSTNCNPVPGLCAGTPGTWSLLASGVGVGVSSDGSTLNGPEIDITAQGSLHDGLVPEVDDGPWCGWSAGSGNVSVHLKGFFGQSKETFLEVHWVQSAGSMIVFSTVGTGPGGSQILPPTSLPTTSIHIPGLAFSSEISSWGLGMVVALPPTPVLTPGQSCVSGSANSFAVVGAAVFGQAV